MGIYNLDKIFSSAPSSNSVIAIISSGSCRRQSKEWQLYRNLLNDESSRQIYLIDHGHAHLSGCPVAVSDIYSSLKDLPEAPELVVTLGPLADIPELLDGCGVLRVSCLVVMSSKTDLESDRLKVEIAARARKNRIRILGLNSAGFMVPAARINLSLFNIEVSGGRLALLSQSGAVITSVLEVARKRGSGFSHIVGLGNLNDINFGDMIDYLGWSAKVSCILLYLENIKDVKNFMSACRSVAMIKPIVAIKAGKSELGRKLVEKHTGCQAGDDPVYDTAFRRAGIIRVESIDELLTAGDFLINHKVPAGRRLGIVTNSGGLGIMAVDALASRSISVSELSADLSRRLKEFVAPYSGSLDPICIAADADEERYRKVLELIFAAREFDTIIVIMVLNSDLDPVSLVEKIRPAAAAARVHLVYAWIGDQNYSVAEIAGLDDCSTRICFTVEDAILSCYYALRYYEKLSKLVLTPQRYSSDVGYNREQLARARESVESYLDNRISSLSSHATRKFIALYGLPVNPSYITTSLSDTLRLSANLGYPVVMKINCHSFDYKRDIAGIILNLHNDDAVRKGFTYLNKIALEAGLSDFNLILEKMVEGVDYEVNLGSRYDIEFGPYIFLGPGGVASRVTADEAVILPPLDRNLAGRLIDRTRLSRCYREVRTFDLEALKDILVRLSQMVVDLPEIETLIFDPLTITGDRLLIVDAKLKLKPCEIASPAHLTTTPYPNQYEFNETLKDGTAVLIRPIKPEDAAAHHCMVAGFSPQTRYFRFFSLREEITPEQLARFTQIDYEREIAMIAEVENDGEKISIGVNRLIFYPHTGEYEFAIVVTDRWQHSGAGYLLMDKLIYVAKDRGIKEIFGLVLRDNLTMMNFIKKFGFEVVEREIDVCRVRLKLVDD